MQILNRRQKNNPCLIGEPGVGKTAIAEGLAQKIVSRDVPYKLLDKEVYLMDLTALVAGTQFRGQFESRMKGLIEEVKKLGNIILVIDEVHNLVGAGDAEGSMNAANILKPALSRGEIQVIGATTFSEYRKYIEKDSALERRFQPVIVAEPTIDESIAILRGISHYYEAYHGVVISPEIARQAVILSERYITDRFLPDKAIDLIDEACSDVNLHNRTLGKLMELRKEHDDIDLELGALTENAEKTQEDYERMATLRSRNLQLDTEIAKLEQEPKPALTIENLARIIELWTKIPASKIRAQEYEQLRNLEANLKKIHRRSGRGHFRRRLRHPQEPRRHQREKTPGLVYLRRLDRRRQDGAGQAAGVGAVLLRGVAYPARYVRVHGKTQRFQAHRFASRLCRV